MITFMQVSAIGGWTFTPLTGFGGASGFGSWGRDCFLRFPYDGSRGRGSRQPRHHPWQAGSDLATPLLEAVEGKASQNNRDPVRRAKELLQLMASLPPSKLKARGEVIAHQCTRSVRKHGWCY